MNLTEAIKTHGLEWLRGRPIGDGSRKLFIHDNDLDAAISLWEDEPHHAYRQRRFYGGTVRNAPMVCWIYGSYPVLVDEPIRQTAKECAAIYGHGNPDALTTLSCLSHQDAEYELRICSSGDAAYFEWINECGDPVGQPFFEFDGIEHERTRLLATFEQL